MKKLTLCVLFCMLSGVYCFAGPFGIDMGMSLEQVKTVCKNALEPFEDDKYIITPPKTSDLFETYVVRIDPDQGVYTLIAIGKEIQTNNYGQPLVGSFEFLVKSIERTYGKYNRTDKKYSALGDNPEMFMYALANGDRNVGAIWNRQCQSTLPDTIDGIFAMISASSSSCGHSMLMYRFSNAVVVDAKADTVF